MLPPALFYALSCVLLFFGVLRLTYLGVFADRRKAAKRTDDQGPRDDADDEIEGETRQERYRQPARMGFGLISFMGMGRMSPAKRHTVMGALWIVMGLYIGWTGYSMSRKQAAERNYAERNAAAEPVRVIRAAPPK